MLVSAEKAENVDNSALAVDCTGEASLCQVLRRRTAKEPPRIVQQTYR